MPLPNRFISAFKALLQEAETRLVASFNKKHLTDLLTIWEMCTFVQHQQHWNMFSFSLQVIHSLTLF